MGGGGVFASKKVEGMGSKEKKDNLRRNQTSHEGRGRTQCVRGKS